MVIRGASEDPEAAGGTAHGTNDLETLMMMGEEMPSLRPALTHMMSRNMMSLSYNPKP